MCRSTLLLTALILVLSDLRVTQSEEEIIAECHQSVSLPCSGVQCRRFHSVTWYRITEKRQGLIKWSANSTSRYGNREAAFGNQYSLLLSQVTPQDSATYECFISANVGEKSLKVLVQLRVKECRTPPEPPAGNTTLRWDPQVHEVSLLWTLFFYGCAAVGKICLSITSVWIFEQISKRHQKTGRRRKSLK